MEALWAKQAALDAERGVQTSEFDVTVRGGAWTRKHKGVAVDVYLAFATTREANAFAVTYRLQRSNSFTIRRYGEEWCMRLGQLWCARMTHFFEIWKSQGSAATYKFTIQDAASYEEPAEIREADWGSANRAVQKRAATLRRMGPRVA